MRTTTYKEITKEDANMLREFGRQIFWTCVLGAILFPWVNFAIHVYNNPSHPVKIECVQHHKF